MKRLKSDALSGPDVIVLAIADHQGFVRGDPESGKPCGEKLEDMGIRFAEPVFEGPENQPAVEEGGIEASGTKCLAELAQRVGLGIGSDAACDP